MSKARMVAIGAAFVALAFMSCAEIIHDPLIPDDLDREAQKCHRAEPYCHQ